MNPGPSPSTNLLKWIPKGGEIPRLSRSSARPQTCRRYLRRTPDREADAAADALAGPAAGDILISWDETYGRRWPPKWRINCPPLARTSCPNQETKGWSLLSIRRKRVASRTEELAFARHSYDDRLAVLLENCEVECPLGFQLCSLFRCGYVAQFSLPLTVPAGLARKAVDAALARLREIDAGPQVAVRDQQFVVYRAYLRPAGTLSVAQHVVSGGRSTS